MQVILRFMMSEEMAHADLYDDMSVSIEIPPDATLEQIKELVFQATGFPVAAQGRLIQLGKMFEVGQTLATFINPYFNQVGLLAIPGDFAGWDLSKSPRSPTVTLLQHFLNNIANETFMSGGGDPTDNLLQHYRNTVLAHRIPEPAYTAFDTLLLQEIAKKSTDALGKYHLHPALIDFLGTKFLEDHALSYPDMIAKYQDDVLLASDDPDPGIAAIMQFKKLFVQKMTADPLYKNHSDYALSEIQQSFLEKMPFSGRTPQNLVQIQYYGDQRRKGEKYPHLRLFTIRTNEIFPLIKYSVENLETNEPYRFQLLVYAGHVTCIDVEISPDKKVSCCILDSISEIDRSALLPVLEQIHSELDGSVVHFISTVPGASALSAAQMQGDMHSCERFSAHLAVQAGKIANLHQVAHNAVDRPGHIRWVRRFREQLPSSTHAWLKSTSWAQLSPKFVKYSQSIKFFQGHHPEAKYPEEGAAAPREFIRKMPIKVKKRTDNVKSADELEPYLRGPVTRAHDFLEKQRAKSQQNSAADDNKMPPDAKGSKKKGV